MTGDPLSDPRERKLADFFHSIVTDAMREGMTPPGVLEVLTAVAGAVIAREYPPALRRRAFDAFKRNTWSAIRGFEIYAAQHRTTHDNDR